MTDAASGAWAFCIPGALPSLNEYVDACRRGPHVGARMKRKHEALIAWHVKSEGLATFDGPVFITFAWHEPTARRDADNVAFAKKFILDALVGLGVLPDDNRRYVTGFADEFHIDRESPRVVVTIERRPA